MVDHDTLLSDAITQDLFGSGSLTEVAELEVPDKYELLECLGRGGFGVVHKARDRSLDRIVALKFLSDARPADLERFRREARFTARLTDPAIVQIFEFVGHGSHPYIAMQFIDGPNLAQAGLGVEEIVRAIRVIVPALGFAHDAGIVHRDVKPANILIGANGQAYLTDFGIARDTMGRGGATISLDGVVMGTPALMPPEQVRGALQAIDARSDIYSIGATLFQLLTGRYPFERDNLIDVLHAVLHDPPPLPRSINPEIPRALESIMVKCMQKTRADRYQSASELGVDLDAFLAGGTVERESTEWFRKMIGAGPREPASDSDLYETVGMDISREIAAWDADLYRVSGDLTRHFARLDSIVERLDSIIADSPHFAWARFFRGVALFRRGKLDGALDEMECSIDRLADHACAQFEMGRLYLAVFLRAQTQARKHMSQAGMRQDVADVRGRLRQAVVAFREAECLRTELLQWQPAYARAVTLLADEDYDGCVAACDGILADDPDIEDVWKLRGDAVRFGGGDPFESYERATTIRRSYVEAYIAQAEACLERHRPADARKSLERVLTVVPEHSDALALLGQCRLNEASELVSAGRDDEARASIAEALERMDRVVELHPQSYEAHLARVQLLHMQSSVSGDVAPLNEALTVLRRAESLNGCQNRVSCLCAATHLDRARLSVRYGLDPTDDLRLVLTDENQKAAEMSGPGPWQEVLAAARDLMDKWSAGQ